MTKGVAITDLSIRGNQLLKSCDPVTQFLASLHWHMQLQPKREQPFKFEFKLMLGGPQVKYYMVSHSHTLCLWISMASLLAWGCHCPSELTVFFFFLLLFHSSKIFLPTRSSTASMGRFLAFCIAWKSGKKEKICKFRSGFVIQTVRWIHPHDKN